MIKSHDVGTIHYIEWLILIDRVQPLFIAGVRRTGLISQGGVRHRGWARMGRISARAIITPHTAATRYARTQSLSFSLFRALFLWDTRFVLGKHCTYLNLTNMVQSDGGTITHPSVYTPCQTNAVCTGYGVQL